MMVNTHWTARCLHCGDLETSTNYARIETVATIHRTAFTHSVRLTAEVLHLEGK